MRAESWLIEKMARRLIRDHTRRRARAIQAVVAVFMSQLLVVSGLFLLWSMIGGAEQLTRQLDLDWTVPGAAELVDYVGSAISLLIGCAIGGGVYGRLAPDALPTRAPRQSQYSPVPALRSSSPQSICPYAVLQNRTGVLYAFHPCAVRQTPQAWGCLLRRLDVESGSARRVAGFSRSARRASGRSPITSAINPT